MSSHRAAEVRAKLLRAHELARLVGDEPLVTRERDAGRVQLLRRRAIVAEVRDPGLIEFLERAPGMLRALAATVDVILTEHGAEGETCTGCGQRAPCRTRRLATSYALKASG